jgi:hypothetical protein
MDRVAAWIKSKDPTGELFASVLRDTYDQLYDGSRTGRFDPADLRKTESTHMGSLVEINLHRAFEFNDGAEMDYEIDGLEVDCKFSKTLGGWMIPQEAVRKNHLLLVVWADDYLSRWEAGLVRATEFFHDSTRLITKGGNQDLKRSLTVAGQARVRYLYPGGKLIENLLLHLDSATRDRIFNPTPHRRRKPSGQAKTDMLFRLVQRRLVNRASVETVAQQKDPMKRAREAREPKHLGAEGILVLGHQDGEDKAARHLGLPVPRKGSFVSARVVPAEPSWMGESAEIAGGAWRLAQNQDPVVPAPLIPKPSRKRTEEDDE